MHIQKKNSKLGAGAGDGPNTEEVLTLVEHFRDSSYSDGMMDVEDLLH